jgi:hypothetical protein
VSEGSNELAWLSGMLPGFAAVGVGYAIWKEISKKISRAEKSMTKMEKALLTVVQELIAHVERVDAQNDELSKRPRPERVTELEREVARWTRIAEDAQRDERRAKQEAEQLRAEVADHKKARAATKARTATRRRNSKVAP